MKNLKKPLGLLTSFIVLGGIGMILASGSSAKASGAEMAPVHSSPVTITGPLPLPVKGSATVTGAVSVNNFPATQSVNVTNASLPVNVTNASLPVNLARTPVSDAQFFNVTQPGTPDVTLTVPAGVVLTDAHVTFSTPESIPNAAALFVNDGTKTYVYQLVNNTTFGAGVDLTNGIVSNGKLGVTLSCYNISGNQCIGSIMWSGYTTP